MTSLDKRTLRQHARPRRAVFARDVPDFAQRIAAFAEQLDITAHAVVAGYSPVRDEADPRALMQTLSARGAKLALPRINAKGAALSFREWHEGDALVDNHHGIAEPRADAETVTPDVVFVPLLAFDARGHRLGYGGGYYDRTLDALRAKGKILAMGVAYAGQEVSEILSEPHDHALDAVITETGLRKFTTRPE
jgi:5-formyltetrahydrofolate cyclo-ligase